VHQLLDYAKQTQLDLCSGCLNELLTNLQNLLRHGVDARIELTFDLGDELLPVEIDALKIEQVLMNLMINAIDAQPDGGMVHVVTRNIKRSDKSGGRNGVAGDVVQILVRDEGVGMSEEVQKKIFEPFYSTKGENGTGLGLSTAIGIVEQHGGSLTCQSTEGLGTCFELLLPAQTDASAPLPPKEVTVVEPLPIPGEPRVLIVEDDAMVRELTERMLRHSGCETVTCENGREAIDFLSTHGDSIDLVISDNAMPVMDGKNTFKHVKEKYPEMPFLVMSGYLVNLDDYAATARGRFPEGFLQKPVSAKTLRAEIAGALRVS